MKQKHQSHPADNVLAKSGLSTSEKKLAYLPLMRIVHRLASLAAAGAFIIWHTGIPYLRISYTYVAPGGPIISANYLGPGGWRHVVGHCPLIHTEKPWKEGEGAR